MEVTVTVFDITALMTFTVSTSLFISVLRSSYTTPPRNAANEKKKEKENESSQKNELSDELQTPLHCQHAHAHARIGNSILIPNWKNSYKILS